MGAPGGEGEFCSAFLVNALLSNACVSYTSNYRFLSVLLVVAG